MRFGATGTATSGAEVLNVSVHGFWIMVEGQEHCLDFDHFPWFRNARVGQLFEVELFHGHHLHWPSLDVDLDLERIRNPDRFPLVAEEASGTSAG